MPNKPKKSPDFGTKWAAIVKKTSTDERFKQKLLKNPIQVLKENGIEIPPGVTFKIVEDTATVHHLVLPEPTVSKELLEEDLRKLAGGGQPPCSQIQGHMSEAGGHHY